jgi:Protein of unknown function (DUF4019)
MNRRALLLLLPLLAVTSASAQQSPPLLSNPREAEAIDFAVTWLRMIEEGDDGRSFELLAPTFQRNLTRASWKSALEETKAQLGRQISQKLRRVVWYENPPNAPLPGTYAAVEFDSTYENADLHFRYVILHSQNGAPFRVMRNESRQALNKSPAAAPK